MRFLCLHGRGSNSQVFEAQTAALRYQLGAHHQFEFVDGSVPWPQAPEIAHLFPSQDQYYSYVASDSEIDISSFLHDLQDYLSSNGPFDALLGFSQGATLAATYLAQRYHRTPSSSPPDIRLAVFVCGGEPWGLRDGVSARLSVALDGAVIDIPTAHIIGKKDAGYGAAVELSQLCKKEQREVLEFEGGHEVPMGRKVVSEMTPVFERVIDRALFRQ